MTEESLIIGLISGIKCPDGRYYQELVCLDPNGNEVRVIIPTHKDCGESTDCDNCYKSPVCELQESYSIDIGRKMIIKRL